jgi:protein CpxP
VRTFALLATLLLAGGPVWAQAPAPAPSASSSNPTNGATAEAQVDQRIGEMHRRLKITPEQQSAWNAFAQVMRDNVTTTDKAYKDRRASIATMSAPENMQNFAQIEQARAQGVQNLAASFQTLYGTMSDDQKHTADTLFRHYADRAEARKRAPK